MMWWEAALSSFQNKIINVVYNFFIFWYLKINIVSDVTKLLTENKVTFWID